MQHCTVMQGDPEDSEEDAAEEEDAVNNENDPEVEPKGSVPPQGTPTVTPAYQKRSVSAPQLNPPILPKKSACASSSSPKVLSP